MKLVALLNLCQLGVEFVLALTIGSVSLFADSIDFVEDATVNGLSAQGNPLRRIAAAVYKHERRPVDGGQGADGVRG